MQSPLVPPEAPLDMSGTERLLGGITEAVRALQAQIVILDQKVNANREEVVRIKAQAAIFGFVAGGAVSGIVGILLKLFVK